MIFRDSLAQVLSEYPIACKQKFKGHPLANFIRDEIPEILRNKVNYPERYLFVGARGLDNGLLPPGSLSSIC